MRRISAGLALACLVASSQRSAGQWVRSVDLSHRKDDDRARAAVQLARRLVAVQLAGTLVAVLPGILDQFRARRRALLAANGDDLYPRDGVAALLDSTESALASELKKDKLAPVRDYVAEVFQQARRDLRLSTRTARRSSGAPRVALAAFRWAADEPAARLERVSVDAVLDRIESFLKELSDRSTKKDFLVDLCLVSAPKEGAKVWLHSKSDREVYDRKTTGRLESLFRGKYFYRVERRAFQKIDCEPSTTCLPIDLWDKRQPVLTCDLSEGSCDVREGGWPAGCRK